MMIWCILCSFFALASGMDVEFSYEKACYSVGDTVNMNARYTGSGTVTAVQWYYSKQNSQNLLVVASNCIAGTPIDTGYPLVSRMSYICDLAAKEFKLTLSSVKEEEFNEAWGATFSLSADASPGVVQKEMNLCTTTPGGLDWWIILIIVIAIVLVLFLAGIILGCFLRGNNAANGNGCCDCDGFPTWYKILWYTVIGIPVALGVLFVWKCC